MEFIFKHNIYQYIIIRYNNFIMRKSNNFIIAIFQETISQIPNFYFISPRREITRKTENQKKKEEERKKKHI